METISKFLYSMEAIYILWVAFMLFLHFVSLISCKIHGLNCFIYLKFSIFIFDDNGISFIKSEQILT